MPGEGPSLWLGAACKARTENEVSAKTHLYSSYVAAKPHSQGRGMRGELAHDSEAHRYAAYGKCGADGEGAPTPETHRQFAHLPQGDLRRGRYALVMTDPVAGVNYLVRRRIAASKMLLVLTRCLT